MLRPSPAHRLRFVATASLLLVVSCVSAAGRRQNSLPSSLADGDFWTLTEHISEPNGFFQSLSGSTDNLLSNEPTVSAIAGAVGARVQPSGVYLGVGPEQNFTYIAAIRPRIAFITDIRRGNLHLHLMYKALFELSTDREDFVGRLFSRKRPVRLTSSASVSDLMNAYLAAAPVDEAGFKANLKAIDDHLTVTRHLPLPPDDLTGIEYVYRNFYRFGPGIYYTATVTGQGRLGVTYAALMTQVDPTIGASRTYLASDENFSFVKTLESENLIVPLVGDFAGPKALRAVGAYLKEHGATVTAFYVSNVEDYLQRNGVWPKFCANVAALPLDPRSVFIRPAGGGGRAGGSYAFGKMAEEVSACAGKK